MDHEKRKTRRKDEGGRSDRNRAVLSFPPEEGKGEKGGDGVEK